MRRENEREVSIVASEKSVEVHVSGDFCAFFRLPDNNRLRLFAALAALPDVFFQNNLFTQKQVDTATA
jgi:hypothetical protein